MAEPRKHMRYLAIAFALVLTVVGLSACGSDSDTSSSADTGSSTNASADSGSSSSDPYTIYLNINGTFNSWRTQMQHTVEFAAQNPPLKDKVDFKFVASPEDLSGQAKDLNNIIATQPDAILIDAASATGLNAQITKACSAGIAVVSFDNIVSSPCAYKLKTPIGEYGELLATHVGEQLDGKGEVIIDTAFPGTSIADELFNGYKTGVEKFPGIKIAGTMESKWEPGRVKSQLNSLLAAHPGVDAVLFDIYVEPALQAFEEAGVPMPKIAVGTITNGDVEACEAAKVECSSSSNPPYLGAEALKFAVELLDGEVDEAEKEVLVDLPYLFTSPVPQVPGFENATIEQAKSIPGLTKEAVLPTAPKWLDITPQEATGS